MNVVPPLPKAVEGSVDVGAGPLYNEGAVATKDVIELERVRYRDKMQ